MPRSHLILLGCFPGTHQVPQGLGAFIRNPSFLVVDNNSVGHAFMRSPSGKTVVFDVTKPVSNPYGWGRELWGKNEEGVIVGEFIDAGVVVHSFLLIPEE